MGRFFGTMFVAIIWAGLIAVTAAAAEKQGAGPRLFGTFAPKPGVWSEYAIFDKASGRRTVMHLSIVGIEDNSYWYEIVDTEGDDPYIVKMLVNGDPNDPANIHRIITKSGKKPARETPPDLIPKDYKSKVFLLETRSGIPVNRESNLRNIKTGDGEATVPAGSFAVSLHRVLDKSGKVYAEYIDYCKKRNKRQAKPIENGCIPGAGIP